jgi:hypothetical protein
MACISTKIALLEDHGQLFIQNSERIDGNPGALFCDSHRNCLYPPDSTIPASSGNRNSRREISGGRLKRDQA